MHRQRHFFARRPGVVVLAIGMAAFASTARAQPANDECVGALAITDGPTAFDTTTAATSGPNSSACNVWFQPPDGTIHQDVWFSYVATCTGNAVFEVSAAADVRLAVHDGGVCPPTGTNVLGCFQSFLGPPLAIPVIAGNVYTIQVGSAGGGGFVGLLTISCPRCGNGIIEPGEDCDDGNLDDTDACRNNCTFGPPVNDECVGALAITTGPTPFDATLATTSGPDMPACNPWFAQPPANNTIFQDLWFSYVATGTGTATFDVVAAADIRLAVHGGATCPIDDSNILGCYDSRNLTGPLSVQVIAGNDYIIHVGTVGGGPMPGPLASVGVLMITFATAVCGDGIVNVGEECDDGNADNTDACVDPCRNARCGDGFLWAGVEECEDGNTVDGDGCEGDCTFLRSVSCDGAESGGSGDHACTAAHPFPLDYAYPVTDPKQNLTSLYIGTDDPSAANYTNRCMPPGWTFDVVSDPFGIEHNAAKTQHGLVSAGQNITGAWVIHFTGPAGLPGGVFTFGFDHPWPSHDVGWRHVSASMVEMEDWAAPVGLGVGPVHAPSNGHLSPIPTTGEVGLVAMSLLLMMVGGSMIAVARRRTRVNA